jgi:hypothetical protein
MLWENVADAVKIAVVMLLQILEILYTMVATRNLKLLRFSDQKLDSIESQKASLKL